jgi:hypothetical protein
MPEDDTKDEVFTDPAAIVSSVLAFVAMGPEIHSVSIFV